MKSLVQLSRLLDARSWFRVWVCYTANIAIFEGSMFVDMECAIYCKVFLCDSSLLTRQSVLSCARG